jgi:hypothetical protein
MATARTANPFDEFDAPATGASSANPFDEFDASPSTTFRQQRGTGDPAVKERVKSLGESLNVYLTEDPDRSEYSGVQTGVATAGGAGLGAVAPKALQYGGKALSILPGGYGKAGKVIEKFGEEFGKTSALKRTAGGGAAGGATDVLEQTGEVLGIPRMYTMPASAAAVAAAPSALKGALSLLPGRVGVTLRGASKTLDQLLKSTPEELDRMPKKTREMIETQLNRIRGGERSLEPQIEIYRGLKEMADNTLLTARLRGYDLDDQAKKLVDDFKNITIPEKTQRINAIQSQFEKHAENLRQTAEARGKIILEEANIKAAQLYSRAESGSTEVKRKASKDAQAIVDEARKRIKADQDQTNGEINRVQKTIQNLRKTSGQRVEKAEQGIKQIGEPVEATPFGQSVRTESGTVLGDLKLVRENEVKTNINNVRTAATQKEAGGFDYRTDSPAYQNFVRLIEKEKFDPETGLVSNPQQLQSELDSLLIQLKGGAPQAKGGMQAEMDALLGGGTGGQDKRLSFDALEKLRRIYRDEAFGLPKERASAMSQQQSGRIADAIEAIQKDMVGKDLMDTYLRGYAKSSEPLKVFNTPVGQVLTGKNVKDPDLFKRYAADIGPVLFNNAESVQQLTAIVGKPRAEELARQFVATELRFSSPDQIKNFVQNPKVKDWIVNFPALQKELEAGSVSALTAKTVAEKRGVLAGALGTQTIPKITSALERRTGERTTEQAARARQALTEGRKGSAAILTDAEKQAQALTTGAQTRAGELVTGAEKTIAEQAPTVQRRVGQIEKEIETGLTETQKQAAQLTGQKQEVMKVAEKKANDLLSNTTDESRLRDIFFSSNEKEWDALAEMVKSRPDLQDSMSRAIGQLVASRPNMGEQTFKEISNRLTSRGLASVDQMLEMGDTLKAILLTPISVEQKSQYIYNMIKRAIGATGGLAAGGAVSFAGQE